MPGLGENVKDREECKTGIILPTPVPSPIVSTNDSQEANHNSTLALSSNKSFCPNLKTITSNNISPYL